MTGLPVSPGRPVFETGGPPRPALNCQGVRADHPRGSYESLDSEDRDLAEVVACWREIPDHFSRAILTLVRASRGEAGT